MNKKVLVKNGLVLLPEGLRKQDLELCDGTISSIGREIPARDQSVVVEAEGKYVLPGFIDIHTNGIGGFDLTNGVYDLESENFVSSEDAYLKGLDNALRKFAETGITRAILTSLASPVSDLKRVFGYVSKYKNDGKDSIWKDIFGGIFVEGTFMKLIDYRGAHNPSYFYEPSVRLFEELQEAASGLIKVVNVVPEWGEPAFNLIEYLSSRGIVCSAGHTGATGVQYDEAIRRGTRLAVHFLNGPTGSSAKSLDGGGALENVLRADEMFVEIIADGYHVDKSYVMDTMKRKGFDKVVIITDSMFATLFEGLQKFRVLGVEGRVSWNGQYLQIADRENALFGSVLTMDAAFSNVLNWLTVPVEGIWYRRHAPLSFEDALIQTSSMCSANPARVLGVFEPDPRANAPDLSGCTGSIEVGKSADVVIASIEKSSEWYDVNVETVFVKGKRVESN